MQSENDFNQLYADEQLRRSQNVLRRIIKYFYLNSLLANVTGRTVDLGCGAGQLLRRLPAGSLGLELNPFLIKNLTSMGMNIQHYDMTLDDYRLSLISPNQYKTLVISHVLEHFQDADIVMRKLFDSASRLGISRILIVVPGKVGYESDKTHRTFINYEYIKNKDLESISDYKLIRNSYFPIPFEFFGSFFIYQELQLVYDKI
jgi:SAM-dependent methyltransferase